MRNSLLSFLQTSISSSSYIHQQHLKEKMTQAGHQRSQDSGAKEQALKGPTKKTMK